jgi:hypothetical protein
MVAPAAATDPEQKAERSRMSLSLAHSLADERLQRQFERALAITALDDPEHFVEGWGRDRIFVSIAAFRDPELQHTLKDLFDKAAHPERITVGLIWQFDPVFDRHCFEVPCPRPGQVREMQFDWRESDGVCWARFLGQALWRGEAYVWQIDSHMRFAPGWDDLLIADWTEIGDERALIASTPPPYLSPGDFLADLQPGIVRTNGFLPGGAIRFQGVWPSTPMARHHRMPFLMAGCLFAPGRFVQEVPYDPYQAFENEEITWAVRAFTHGWNVYSPKQRVVWHQYVANNTIKRGAVEGATQAERRHERSLRALHRYNEMTGHARCETTAHLADLDLFGLGTARSLGAFEDFAGLCFRTKRASEHAIRARYIAEIDDIATFPVPCLDDPKEARPALMAEAERLLRIQLRSWQKDQLIGELMDLIGAVQSYKTGLPGDRALPAAERQRLLRDFGGWERDAIAGELASLVWRVSEINRTLAEAA